MSLAPLSQAVVVVVVVDEFVVVVDEFVVVVVEFVVVVVVVAVRDQTWRLWR